MPCYWAGSASWLSLEDYNDVFNTGLFICTLEKEVKKGLKRRKFIVERQRVI